MHYLRILRWIYSLLLRSLALFGCRASCRWLFYLISLFLRWMLTPSFSFLILVIRIRCFRWILIRCIVGLGRLVFLIILACIINLVLFMSFRYLHPLYLFGKITVFTLIGFSIDLRLLQLRALSVRELF